MSSPEAPAQASSSPAPGSSSPPNLWRLPLILLVALAVRTIAWLRNAAMMNDGPAFIGIAKRFSEGDWAGGLAHDYHPLYPIAIWLAKPAFASWDAAGAAVSIFAGALAVFALHAFLRRAFDATTAWVGALLLAVHPYAAPFSADVQSEGLYFACFLSAVALTWRALETPPRLGRAFASGLVAGLAYLVRPEGVGPILVGVGFVGLGVLRRELAFGVALRWAAVAGLGTVVAMAPYLGAVALEEGELTLTRKKSIGEIATLSGTAAVPAPPAETVAPSAPSPPATAEAATPPSRVRAVWVAIAEPVRHGFRTDHLVLLAFGLFAVRGRPGPRAIFLGGLVTLYAFVLVGLQLSAGYVSMRHVLPPLLACLGYVALGVPVAGRILLAGPAWLLGRRVSPRAALAFGLVLLLTASTLMAIRPRRENRIAVRSAAEWLATHAPEAERVGAIKQRDAYYAGAEWVRLPPATGLEDGVWERVLESHGIAWLVVDGKKVDRYPALRAEAARAEAAAAGDRTADASPRLRLVHRAEHDGRWAGVWQLVAATGEGP